MKILVVGGTGHIGSYLVPRLVRAGHQVLVVARQSAPRYTDPRLCWPQVEWIAADRAAEETAGTWLERLQAIEVDAVVDLICYTQAQNRLMHQAFAGRVGHFLHCGTIWTYGPVERAPYEEHFPRRPITDYGIRKARIEADLLAAHRAEGFPATIIHPGHISGRRWLPIDPQGSRDGVGVYRKLAGRHKVQLPDMGLATLHHVHGDDVAQLFQLAIEQRERSLGESFSAVAPYAMSLLGCCRFVASLFGQEPDLEFVPLSRLVEFVGQTSHQIIHDHVVHSPCSSIAKGQRLLGYQPRYTTEQIYVECIEHLLESGQLER
jgi:nucleoside-diphosphate-sugar epimerase